jgi:molybdopterin-biosynthesis enzyme MoeA-like protein
MVERPRPPTTALAFALAWMLCSQGCAFVPKSRFEEAQKLVQSLRAQNAQLKDSSLTLKVQNQELAQRAVDDSKAIRALEVANDQYELSIQGYQDEREQLQAAFSALKNQVRTASSSGRTED